MCEDLKFPPPVCRIMEKYPNTFSSTKKKRKGLKRHMTTMLKNRRNRES